MTDLANDRGWAQRMERLWRCARWFLSRAMGVPLALARALWSWAGSAQVRNAMLLALALSAVAGADQLGRMARALSTVGDAQRIAGFALMRQLQAEGVGPGGARAAVQPARAIDPSRLATPDAGAARAAGAPVRAGGPAPAFPSIP